MERFDSAESTCSDCSDYEFTCPQSITPRAGINLQFDPTWLEKIILLISDNFDVRIIYQSANMATAVVVTSGLAIAGGLIGKQLGGKIGAAVGGAVGGACGVGIVAYSMRDVWTDIKGKLPDLYDIVYDYIAGLGIEDYQKAASFLMHNSGCTTQLVMIMVQLLTDTLGNKVLSNLTTA